MFVLLCLLLSSAHINISSLYGESAGCNSIPIAAMDNSIEHSDSIVQCEHYLLEFALSEYSSVEESSIRRFQNKGPRNKHPFSVFVYQLESNSFSISDEATCNHLLSLFHRMAPLLI